MTSRSRWFTPVTRCVVLGVLLSAFATVNTATVQSAPCQTSIAYYYNTADCSGEPVGYRYNDCTGWWTVGQQGCAFRTYFEDNCCNACCTPAHWGQCISYC